MAKTAAWLIAGAVIATAGAAHAQELNTPQERAEVRAATPWYERFTTSTGLTENITGVAENDRFLSPSWALSGRWGVTINVQEAQRAERGPEPIRPNQAAVGAYYQFTPRVRVGGEVSLQAPTADGNPVTRRNDDPAQPATGVKLESAFRF